MAHFAKLDDNNTVLEVHVVNNDVLLDENGVEQESKGVEFLQSIFGGRWVQTSYNASFRKNYAAPGMIYNETIDGFIAKQPYPSWTLNEDVGAWFPPVPLPLDAITIYTADSYEFEGTVYRWNEEALNWTAVTDLSTFDGIGAAV